ncbi:MAG: Helix-turn-helix domain [Ilumatobacteraceae bacterium]|nr:Helix-turn-helix domain [Ilumatobacteraceae bacterium]
MAELEARWHDLGEFIREQRKVGHLSLRKLSDMAGISNPYLSQIERGLRKPSAEILQQIARALEISSETLYIRAGILEPREGDTDLVTEIRRDIWLNEEQKKTLVQIYESFCAERRAAGFEPELLAPRPAGGAAAPVNGSSGRGEPDEPVGSDAAGAADDLDDPESEALAGR